MVEVDDQVPQAEVRLGIVHGQSKVFHEWSSFLGLQIRITSKQSEWTMRVRLTSHSWGQLLAFVEVWSQSLRVHYSRITCDAYPLSVALVILLLAKTGECHP